MNKLVRVKKSRSTRLLRSQTRNKEKSALKSKNLEEDTSPESIPTEHRHSSSKQQAHQKSGGLTCPSKECGRTIAEPLEMVDLSKESEKTVFYVCPYCMSRLNVSTEPESAPELPPMKRDESGKIGKTGPQNCPHYLGYLQERAKNTQIPDECLTCPEIIRCMLG